MFQWIRRIFSVEDPTVPLTSAKIQDWLGVGQDSNAGVRVSEATALGVPAFLKGVNLISNSVAKTPLHIYRKSEDGRERATTHPADKLFNGKFNKWQSSLILRQTIQKDALVYGNGYGWIERDEFANPVAIYRLDPVETYPEFKGNQLLYRSSVNNEEIYILPDNVLHIRGVGDGFRGHAVLHYLADSIGLGIAQQRYSAKFFGNGAVPALGVKMKGRITSEEQKQEFKRSWNSIHQGPSNAHKIVLLEEDMDVTPISLDPQTSQLLESRKFALIDFANLLGIPASWLGAAVNTSFKSLEHEDRAFLRDGLDYWLCQWEAEIDMKLLTERQQKLHTHYSQYVREALIRMETKDERSVLLSEYHGGLRSWEECRNILNSPTDQDGFYLRPTNLQPETFEEEPEPAPEPPPEPVEEAVEEVEVEPEEVSQSLDERLEGITAATIKRLFTRLDKASNGKGPEWLLEEMKEHWSIFSQSLSPVASEEDISKLWDEINEELAAVSSKDWGDLVWNKDCHEVARGLLNVS